MMIIFRFYNLRLGASRQRHKPLTAERTSEALSNCKGSERDAGFPVYTLSVLKALCVFDALGGRGEGVL